MGRLFGTDGVRGVANKELTASLAFDIGRAAAFVLGKGTGRPLFVVGRDTRVSGDMLENALTAGILSVGGNVMKLGVIPTPAVAYLVRHYDADAGVVISASHNSFEYNGIKLFNGDGFKLDDSIEEEIEDIILAREFVHPEFVGDKLGKCVEAEEDALSIYTKFLLSTIDISLDGVKVVIDTANGASYKTARMVYEALGAEVHTIANDPDGININDNCGSTHPENLLKEVVKQGADIGMAYDGDADRLVIADEKGRLLDGDRVMCICGKMLKDEGTLNGDLVTATVMSNIGFHRYLEDNGMKAEVTKVGDRYVLESMLKTGSVLGGEQSGHMIFLNYTTTGDGVLSSLQFVKAWKASGKKVSELRDGVTIYPQALVNARVTPAGKASALKDQEVQNKIAEVEEKLGDTGRVLIRPSGTEPLMRVMIEGEDEAEIASFANEIAQLILSKYGDDK